MTRRGDLLLGVFVLACQASSPADDPPIGDASTGGGSGGGASGEGGDSAGGATSPPEGPAVLTITPAQVTAYTGTPGRLTVSNTGGAAATFERLRLVGSGAFVPLIAGLDPRREASLIGDPDQDGTPGLSPGARFEIEVRLAAVDDRTPQVATLTLEAHESPPLTATLTDFNPETCLQVEPAALDFQAVVGERAAGVLAFSPCLLGQTVVVDDARVDEAEGALFELSGDTPPLPWSIADRVFVGVEYLPAVAGTSESMLTLGFDAEGPLDEEMFVPLRGLARENQCPRAYVAVDHFDVTVTDVVPLDGSASVDPDGPDGRPVQYGWVVIERPAGSTSNISERVEPADPSIHYADDPATPMAYLWADMVGRYTAELRVVDDRGLSNVACEVEDARLVTIDVHPPAPPP